MIRVSASGGWETSKAVTIDLHKNDFKLKRSRNVNVQSSNLLLLLRLNLPMVCHSLLDGDITLSGSTKYGFQVLEPSERETPGQWLPPSHSFHTGNQRLPIGPSQSKREDRRPQLVTKHWLASDRHVDLPDGHRTLANITGRSYDEAFRDLGRLHLPRESPQHTSSIAPDSDDSHSRDSPSISTPSNSIKDLSLSPKLVSGVAQASFQNSEATIALPFHPVEIASTSKSSQRDNISVSVLQSSASPDVFRKDVMKCVESPVAYCASEPSMPRFGAPPRLLRSFQNSEFAFSRRAVQKLGVSTTQPPLRQPLCVAQSYTEDLIVSAKKIADDAYPPEPKPTSGSGIRGSLAKKLSKSSSLKFGCPQCPRRFTRNFDMSRHMKNIHLTQTVETINALTCTCCGQYLSRRDAFKRHIERVPNSCIRVAKLKQKPAPALLSEETYAIRKIAMMEVCTRQSSHTS